MLHDIVVVMLPVVPAILFVSDHRLVLYDPAEVWPTLVTGGVEVHQIPGDHNAILSEPHVRIVAEQIQRTIDR